MLIVVVDKLIQTLKNRILIAYIKYVKRTQKGYPLENYSDIIEAMMALDYIERFEVPDDEKIKIIDHYIIKLNNDE